MSQIVVSPSIVPSLTNSVKYHGLPDIVVVEVFGIVWLLTKLTEIGTL